MIKIRRIERKRHPSENLTVLCVLTKNLPFDYQASNCLRFVWEGLPMEKSFGHFPVHAVSLMHDLCLQKISATKNNWKLWKVQDSPLFSGKSRLVNFQRRGSGISIVSMVMCQKIRWILRRFPSPRICQKLTVCKLGEISVFFNPKKRSTVDSGLGFSCEYV